ncbi:MAG: hypothetical protein M3P39_12030 [Actinomycetota bacterium]|nr:hypothetical protein [Actinomycetota bacterium]
MALVITGSLWYVEAPPRSSPSYSQRTAQTAETLRSQAETARLWVAELADGRTFGASASVGFREAEEDATAALSGFAAYDPPPGTVALRDAVTALGNDVVNSLAQLRIAAADERWGDLGQPAARLARLGSRLDRLARRAES